MFPKLLLKYFQNYTKYCVWVYEYIARHGGVDPLYRGYYYCG